MKFIVLLFLSAVSLTAEAEKVKRCHKVGEEETSETATEILDQAFAELRAENIPPSGGDFRFPFSDSVWAFISGHRDEIYSHDLNGYGTIMRLTMGNTVKCMARKIAKELDFIATRSKKLDPFLVKIWLGDGETDFWPLVKDVVATTEMWKPMERIIRKKLKLKIPDAKDIPDHINWAQGFSLPFSKEAGRAKTKGDFSFTVDEVGFFMGLESAVFAEFLKVMAMFKHVPVSLNYIAKGYTSWLCFRAALLDFYVEAGVSANIIKTRIACFHLAQLYFYERFLDHFSKKSPEEQCKTEPPREYGMTLPCDVYNGSDGKLGEFPGKPCFPK